jgi:hypothetical protein
MKELSTLKNKVTPDSEFKNYIVNYVGEKKSPENEEVTVEMVIDVLSDEFPELVLCLSEENWVRGYEQALTDVDEGMKIAPANNEA